MKAFVSILAALSLSYASASHASNPAGRVIYVFGDVAAVDAQGGERQLERNGTVYGGEMIRTRMGRTHVKFNDNGFAALNPNTSYRIDDFNYDGQPDGSEKGFFSLIKGSVRIVTGIIGHRNKANFKLITPVATIGIRGTSGLIQHCAGDCPGKEDGTYVAGYGGTWELKSGQFDGAVDAGDSYHCTGAGAGCTELEAAPEQREEIAIALLSEEEGPPVESPAAAGLQVDGNGRLCDLGGGCGSAEIANVMFSMIGPGGDNLEFIIDGGADAGVIVSNNGGRPLAFVSQGRQFLQGIFGFEYLDIMTSDVTGLESALARFTDPGLRARAERTLARARLQAPDVFAALAALPATIAPEDFGQTRDGLLTKGRFTGGYLLEFGGSVLLDPETGAPLAEDEIFLNPIRHIGFQSTHFIYGADPGPMEFFGQAVYTFTGGTLSTSASGASIGSGVTSGTLGWVFGLDMGQLDMNVLHGGSNFRVLANLTADAADRRLFSSIYLPAIAFSGSSTTSAYVEGFFAAASGAGLPRAAGLHYVIHTPDLILGAAGFGLVSNTAFSAPAAPAGTVLAWSHAFVDTFDFTGFGPGVLVGMPASAVVDQLANRAVLGEQTIFASTQSSNPICSGSPCTFNSAAGVRVESGSTGATAPALGVSWARFAGSYQAFNPANVDSIGNVTNRGDFHLITSTAPATALPTSGQIVYSNLIGGTSPTLNSGPTGETTRTGALSGASVTIDYGLGDVTDAQVFGSFSGASFAIGSSTATPISSPVMSGTGVLFDSGTCSSGCPMLSRIDLAIVGPGGAGVIGSYGAGTGVVAPGEQHSINGTFVVTVPP